jgi:hypothetical protein
MHIGIAVQSIQILPEMQQENEHCQEKKQLNIRNDIKDEIQCHRHNVRQSKS